MKMVLIGYACSDDTDATAHLRSAISTLAVCVRSIEPDGRSHVCSDI